MGTDAAAPPIPPPEQRVADRLTAQQMPAPMSARAKAVTVLGELGQVDLAVYRAIVGTPSPTLDRPLRRLSAAANWSQLWLATGGVMAVAGGGAGRRAAAAGLVALAVNSAVVNLGLKLAARRRRPDRDSAGVRPRSEGADAGAGVVFIRAYRIRLRLRKRSRAYPARGCGAAGHARHLHRLLPHPHRSALPGRRGNRGRDRHRRR
jgi:hypothetical protein